MQVCGDDPQGGSTGDGQERMQWDVLQMESSRNGCWGCGKKEYPGDQKPRKFYGRDNYAM